jgi:uncharacterized LabA/DUF88 family protein
MDIVRMIKRVDTVVIGSSMSDLVPLVKWIREQGVKVIIMACGVPQVMKKATDQWIDLDELYLENSKENTNNEIAKSTK